MSTVRLSLLVFGLCASPLFAQDLPAPEPPQHDGCKGHIRADVQFSVAFPADSERWVSYTLAVPPGCQSVTISTEGASADVDLFVRHGAPMEDWYQDCTHRSATGLNDEDLLIDTRCDPPIRGGTYYLDVVRAVDEPIEAFQVTVRYNHVSAEDYARRALRREGSADIQGALDDLSRALELDPKRADVWQRRAYLRLELPEADRAGAARDYARALELDPSLAPDVAGTIRESGEQRFKLGEDPRYRTYRLEVPEGCRNVRISASSTGQDLDLYLRFAVPVEEWDASNDHIGDSRRLNEELFVDGAEIPSLLPGTYFLDVVRSGEPAPEAEIVLKVTYDAKVDEAKDASYWFTRAYAAEQADRDERALEAWNKALAIEPDALALFRRGMLHNRLDDYRAAIADLDAALGLDPDPSYLGALLSTRGAAYRGLEDYDSSARDLQAAVEESPQQPDYHVSLARTLMRKNELEQAAAHLQSALELDEQSAYAYYYRAQLNARRGQMEQAITDFQLAVELNPAYVEDFGPSLEEGVYDVSVPAGASNFTTFPLYVPEGTSRLLITVNAAAGQDVDLYLRYGVPMVDWKLDADHAATDGESAEVLDVKAPPPGMYFLDVSRGTTTASIPQAKLTVAFARD